MASTIFVPGDLVGVHLKVKDAQHFVSGLYLEVGRSSENAPVALLCLPVGEWSASAKQASVPAHDGNGTIDCCFTWSLIEHLTSPASQASGFDKLPSWRLALKSEQLEAYESASSSPDHIHLKSGPRSTSTVLTQVADRLDRMENMIGDLTASLKAAS